MLARHSDHRLRHPIAIGASLALGLAGSLLVAAPASAVGSTVTNLNDSGSGSLRQAIIDANADATADTITISATGTLVLASDLPLITAPVSIVGPAGGFTIDASVAEYGIEIDGSTGMDVSISDLTVENAGDDGIRSEAADLTLTRVTIADSEDNGLYASDGNLTLTDVTVDGNGDDGLDIELDGEYTAMITGLTSTGSGSDGIDAVLRDDATLTVEDAEIRDNADSGIFVEAGDAAVTITGSTVEENDGGDSDDICAGGIEIQAEDSDVEIGDSTISDNSGYSGGVCIFSSYSDVSLHDLLIEDNEGEDGGGIHLDVEASDDPLVIADSRVIGNSAESGGGIYVHDAGDEGDYAGIQILRTTIDGNAAEDGGGIVIEDMRPTGTPGTPGVFIQESTISDNHADFDGGGLSIVSDIGATDSLFSSLVVESSTISGNTAENGGGLYENIDNDEQDELTTLHLTVINSTMSGNVADIVGGLYVDGEGLSEDSAVSILNSTITDNTVETLGPAGVAILGEFTATIRNSIIAGNIDLPVNYGDLDISTDLAIDVSYSLIGVPSTDAAGAVSTGTGNITGVDPDLGPLAPNGGPTLTHLPQSDSLAVDAGDPAYSGELTTDQRGLDRVVDRLDMGAVEIPATEEGPTLAATGADAVAPLAGGVLLLGAGGLLLLARRYRSAR
jgi:hypothetical protein